MIKPIAVVAIIFISFIGNTQTNSDHSEIEQAIRTFFEGFHKQDSLMMKSVLFENAQLQTVGFDKESNLVIINEESIPKFLNSIVSIPKEMTFKEIIHDYLIQSDGVLGTAWTPYSFIINDNLSHCGNNSFQLVKTEEGWKIFSIVDTRKKDGCPD
jgi:hypothetical protein